MHRSDRGLVSRLYSCKAAPFLSFSSWHDVLPVVTEDENLVPFKPSSPLPSPILPTPVFLIHIVRLLVKLIACYSVQFSSVAQSCPTLCDPVSITNSQSLLKLMSIASVMPSNHLILSRPLLLLPSIFPSIRVFSNESVLASGGQSFGVLASASVLPMNIQD